MQSPASSRLGTRERRQHHGSAFVIDTGNTKENAYWASSVVSLRCPCMWPASWPSS